MGMLASHSHPTRRDHHEGYYAGHRHRKIRFCSPRGGRPEPDGPPKDSHPGPASGDDLEALPLHHRDGSVRRGAPLGPGVRKDGTHGQADARQIRETVRQDPEERRAGRRSHLRGDGTSEHAVRAGQDGGPAGTVRPPVHASPSRKTADGPGQPHPGAPDGDGDRVPPESQKSALWARPASGWTPRTRRSPPSSRNCSEP